MRKNMIIDFKIFGNKQSENNVLMLNYQIGLQEMFAKCWMGQQAFEESRC